MYFQASEPTGPVPMEQGPEKPYKLFEQLSESLPFGQSIPLAQIAGPTYITSQALVQQVAYSLSDRLWTYSPDTFDLDVAVKQWQKEDAKNVHGYSTKVEVMQVRSGAASIALGYMFSKDFDLSKRHVPQSILASSSALPYLRTSLDQLSLLYSVASPLAVHVSAVDYAGGPSPGLVTDYVSALALSEELGLGLVSSFSTHEAQHMSLFVTLLANVLPTLHIYDGIRVGRETTRVIDVLDQGRLKTNHEVIMEGATQLKKKNASIDTKVIDLLRSFNRELGTDYGLFEYHGHPKAESLLVVFGTVESTLASQVANALVKNGVRIGVINVRVYRPFVEDEFLQLVPKSVKSVGVLGQVQNQQAVSDAGVQSSLYGDVLAAFTFAADWSMPPSVLDIKYPREQPWSPVTIAAAFQLFILKPLLHLGNQNATAHGLSGLQLVEPKLTQQYTFWNLDDSASTNASTLIGKALSNDSSSNVAISVKYDNLLHGGMQRTDIRRSKKTIEAAYPVDRADVIYVGDECILKEADILSSLAFSGKVLLRLPGVKNDDVEKKLPVAFRKGMIDLDAKLYLLDTAAVDTVSENATLETYLIQVGFFRVALPDLEENVIQRLSGLNGNLEIFDALANKLDYALRLVEIPSTWADVENGVEIPKLPSDIHPSSFTPFTKSESESPTLLKDWQTIAKALAFKESFSTTQFLRPDLSTKTYTVHLQEHRRLTPLTYDRNIMHLDFDLGDSGMKYNIGDSLGIHPRNDEKGVQAFMAEYGLDPEAIVESQNRDDPGGLHASTVYQALSEQVDIFGRPSRQFYELLSEFATDVNEKKQLLALGGAEGAAEFKRRAEVDTITYADVFQEFPSAHPEFHNLVRIVAPLKRREYSIASCQKVTPNIVSLMIVTVLWVDPKGRDRFGLATHYLNALRPGDPVTVSLKPSVMKLPRRPTDPIIMAGLGTGLAPFRAFVQHRAWEKENGVEIGPVFLYMGSRHQREEYCYGEEWEAYRDAGVVTLLSCAFSRDQPQKIYIQDRMRQTRSDIQQVYLDLPGAFYLCGPTWPVPDVTAVLEEAIKAHWTKQGKKVTPRKEIEKLKEEGRFVLEVY